MSYLVLARKWRPQVFEDVIGQRPITRTLQNAIAQERVAHAFLFTGARGVGKTSTARILAKALNCEKGPAINPCNQCRTCKEISSGASMDVIEIDGASNRGIDEIRELRENVRYTPAKSRYKIFIIDEVHMLTREAFNALLKTLEEPPPRILFVFATTEPHKIPATILSRCQRYDFKRIPLGEIVESLKRITQEEQVIISPNSLLSLAREAEGSMRDAQSLLDQVISYAGKEIRDEDIVEVLGLVDRKVLQDTLEAIADRDAERCMKAVDQIYQFGYDVQQFCRELLQSFRNLILIKVSSNPGQFVEGPEEELQGLRTLAERFSFDHLNYLFSLLLKGEEEIAQSAFPRTMIEITLIRMAAVEPVVAIEDILKKLEGLEGRCEDTDLPRAGEKRRETLLPRSPKEPAEKTGEFPVPPAKAVETPDPAEEVERLDTAESVEAGAEEGQTAPGAPQEEAWKEILDFTRTRNPVLGAFLAFGDLVHLSRDQIEIGFEKDSFHYERMLESENRIQLEKIFREYLKRDAKLVISPVGQRTRARERAASEARTAAPRGGENPLIQETLRIFNGRIVGQ